MMFTVRQAKFVRIIGGCALQVAYSYRYRTRKCIKAELHPLARIFSYREGRQPLLVLAPLLPLSGLQSSIHFWERRKKAFSPHECAARKMPPRPKRKGRPKSWQYFQQSEERTRFYHRVAQQAHAAATTPSSALHCQRSSSCRARVTQMFSQKHQKRWQWTPVPVSLVLRTRQISFVFLQCAAIYASTWRLSILNIGILVESGEYAANYQIRC